MPNAMDGCSATRDSIIKEARRCSVRQLNEHFVAFMSLVNRLENMKPQIFPTLSLRERVVHLTADRARG